MYLNISTANLAAILSQSQRDKQYAALVLMLQICDELSIII